MEFVVSKLLSIVVILLINFVFINVGIKGIKILVIDFNILFYLFCFC